jgi:serine/threonine protein phosphatase 1
MGFPDRIFVIGDIHGCLDKLQILMSRINPRPGLDQLVFLGDYIDRGEDASGVIEFLLQLRGVHRDTIFLMGNHEKMFLDFLAGKDQDLFLHNGGHLTLKSYLKQLDSFKGMMARAVDGVLLEYLVPESHRAFMDNLLPYHVTESHIMVHAGLRDGIPLENQSLDDLVWIREEFIYSEGDFGKPVIFGHTPFVEPLVLPNKIGIDTGAVYGNTLTCFILPDFEFVSV